MSIATRFPLPVDERAIRALIKRLKEINQKNGYYVDVTQVRRLFAPMQIEQIRNPSEIHVLSGHVMEGGRPLAEFIYRRSAAFQLWLGVPVTILFYAKVPSPLNPDLVYRVFRSEILRAVLQAPIVDDNNKEYPVQVGPGPFEDEGRPVIAQPMYYGENQDWSAGCIELVLLTTFSESSPYLVDAGDTQIFGP